MKKAFTMLELVFVIVVIGILAASIIPNTRRNTLREAATQLVSHIRYTQHLAMVDDKFDANDPKWFQGRWQIVFEKAGVEPKYSIFSDGSTYTGNADLSEVAVDPLNRDKILSGGGTGLTSNNAKAKLNSKLNLNKTYGIVRIVLKNKDGSSNGCKSQTRISFDHLGRPLAGPLDKAYKNIILLNKTCVISLFNDDKNISIAIEPETGYAHIL